MLQFGAFFFSLSVLYIFFDLLQGAGVEASKTGWHPLASADFFCNAEADTMHNVFQ